MTGMWTAVTDMYADFMASGDPRVAPWLLMESPVPTLTLVAVYVAFVKVIGPAWMANKKPYDLRSAMFAYNMCVVVCNMCLVVETFRVLFRSGSRIACRIDDLSDPNGLRMAEMGWWFFFLKLVEFTDTVFFVLRKKFHQISTLHVVHHAVVPVSVWFGFRVEPGNYNFFFPFVNSIVHSVMYTYYGLAALGPHVQKYLWWKKYLTTFQMMQFVVVFIYITLLSLGSCKVSKFIIYLNIFLASLFLLMFYDYFRSTYIKKKSPRNSGGSFKDTDHQLKEKSQKSYPYVQGPQDGSACHQRKLVDIKF